MNTVALIYNFFLEIFFPKRCVGCSKSGGFLCLDCAKKIESLSTPTCPNCGKISKFNAFCPACRRKTKPSLDGLLVAANFEAGPTREVIHHLKYAGFAELSEVLGELISQKILLSGIKVKEFVIVPVPLHPKRLKERGFNQSELIGRFVCKKLKIPGGDTLARIKYTETQTKLNREKRIHNMMGAFICEDPGFIKGKNIVLIDDVTTTGATLDACAAVLKDSGAKKVWGAVVAKRS